MDGELASVMNKPSVSAIEAELSHERNRARFGGALRGTLYALLAVAAVAVLVATLLMPVLRIHGESMAPTLQEGEIVISLKGVDFETGDLVGFYLGNKLLVKRVIAGPGQWVDVRGDGAVLVDGKLIDEPYLDAPALGDCNIEFPYQVPEDKWFVMGDHRATSVDSRNTAVGCVADEQVVGCIVARIWPFDRFGLL